MVAEWLQRDERGVSPVIGVILMVALVVLLSTIISVFVLGIGGDLCNTVDGLSIPNSLDPMFNSVC